MRYGNSTIYLCPYRAGKGYQVISPVLSPLSGTCDACTSSANTGHSAALNSSRHRLSNAVMGKRNLGISKKSGLGLIHNEDTHLAARLADRK